VSHQQEVSLSSREQQVLRLLMAEGRSIPQISRELWITQNTVEAHLRNIIRRLLTGYSSEPSRLARRVRLTALAERSAQADSLPNS
jgi:DNA-binding NarL/FixJ family response regulator